MRRSCSCKEFTRSQLMRHGVAQAGRGLPRIEQGMPLPAGTGMSRRSFLLRSAGGVLAVYGASALSPRHLEAGIAQAAAAAPPKQPVIVSIFMEGGWDALSVLAPVKEAAYHQLRPQLGRQEGEGVAFSEDETLMWHPQAGGLAQLHGEGKVAVFPAIGYDPRTRATSPAATTGRSANSTPRRAPAGWGVTSTSPATPTTPCRVSRSTTRWRRHWRPRSAGGGRLDALGLRLLGLRPGRTANRRRPSKRSAARHAPAPARPPWPRPAPPRWTPT